MFAPVVRSRVLAESASPIGGLVAKAKKPAPPEPRWPDGSPHIEPVQLAFPFMMEV